MDAGAVVMILALLFFAFVALGVYVGVKAIGAAKRGVERTVTQARRTVEETTLRARSYGQVGVTGELAQLRLSLRTSMRATQEALNAGVTEDASLSESLALFRRLSAHGQELDGELKRLEREPDRSTLAALLPGLRERTERITHSAESLRWAARDRAQKFAADDLDELSSQIDMEAGALRHWSAETGVAGIQGTPDTPVPGGDRASRPAADATASWPEAGHGDAAGDSAAAEQTWPGSDADSARADDGRPQAITARDPRVQTTYPWQKSAHPETSN